MKKTTVLLIAVLFMVIGYAAYNATINIYGNAKLAENLNDFKVYLSNLKVNGTEVDGINDTKDEFTINDINGDISVDIVNDSTEYDTEAYLECNVDNTWDFDYTGGEQTFTAPVTDIYKLEVWGAQGGDTAYTKSKEIYRNGGYGAFAFGEYKATSGSVLYVNVGGSGNSTAVDYTNNSKKCSISGGYNGGGNAFVENCIDAGGSGGGATHIATTSGMISTLENKKDSILIVAGGGGGSYAYSYYAAHGGNAGGITGNTPSDLNNGGLCNNNRTLTIGKKATQTESGTTSGCYLDSSASRAGFGYGASVDKSWGSGGGGGYFGGGSGITAYGAGGGSSYIGNSLLSEKGMYCNNCEESNETSTKTVSTTCVNSDPIAACAKSENGYARITLKSTPTNITTDKITIIAQENGHQNIKNLIGKSLTCKLKLNKLSRTKKAYVGSTEWNYDYTGEKQIFTVPITGTYKLENWGAQGGYAQTGEAFGGYGGYSTGQITLNKNDTLYVIVGGKGEDGLDYSVAKLYQGGYNGGGNAKSDTATIWGAGGGATSIQKSLIADGQLKNYSNNIADVLVVAAGGGGGGWHYKAYLSNPKAPFNPHPGGSGGGYIGSNGITENNSLATGGTQSNCGSNGNATAGVVITSAGFGYGGNYEKFTTAAGGGSGFYGGGSAYNNGSSGAGGSGYIGNALLTKKKHVLL